MRLWPNRSLLARRPLIDIHDVSAVRRVASQLKIDPHRVKRLRHRLLQQFASDPDSCRELPSGQSDAFARRVALHPLTLVSEYDSQIDHSTKLLFETPQGGQLESVLLETPTGRVTLCVSSQVGCRVKCEFCATGHLPRVEDLTAGEILDQVVQAGQRARAKLSGSRIRNIVLMGMGEPLQNEQAVTSALEALESPSGFAMSLRRTILSTVGIPQPMIRLARRFPRLRIAVSLHAAQQQLRSELIPLARRHELDELGDALRQVAYIQRQPLMIQYLMIRGLNDSDDDAQRLLAFLEDIPCHVNLIPFNRLAQAPSGSPAANWQPTPQARRDAFASKLRSAGLLATIRYSQGADIAAACGQLGNSECGITARGRRASSWRFGHWFEHWFELSLWGHPRAFAELRFRPVSDSCVPHVTPLTQNQTRWGALSP